MFAGAAREAVFSRPDVIRRVKREFVPVALKAALVNNPPPGREGRFLREIGRSKPAPQGICVANSAGKVLAWALSFDDAASVPRFLDHVLQRHKETPGTEQPVTAQRFMRFPSQRLADVPDIHVALPKPEAHPADSFCPATPPKPSGTVVAKVWGRAVRVDGELVADCLAQENYAEDVFDIPPDIQAELARAVDGAGNTRFSIPDRLARQIVTFAYLGQLDVRPLRSPVPGTRSRIVALEFWATPTGAAEAQVTNLHNTGRSDVRSRNPAGSTDDSPNTHDVTLDWEGYITLTEGRITDLILHAQGHERIRWGTLPLRGSARDLVTRLPAGRPLKVDTRVRFGVVGSPVPDTLAGDKSRPAPVIIGVGGPPAELRRNLQRLQERVRQLAEAGRNPMRLQVEFQKIVRLIQSGQQDEAATAIERALATPEWNGDDADQLQTPVSTLPEGLQRKMEVLHQQIQRLVREGRPDEAERLIDRILNELPAKEQREPNRERRQP